tara:strand:+ start:26031 stop:26876 length:846 start_codon:yes stop_codon:yes gene_type:complete
MNRLFRFLFLILTPIPNNAFLRFSFIKELKWKRFHRKVQDTVLTHPVVTNNRYTKEFAKGTASLNEQRVFIQQFSVFSQLFLIAQLTKVINAPTIEEMRDGKEILCNELGVEFNKSGSIEKGVYRHKSAHFEWLSDIAKDLGFKYTNIGRRKVGSVDTLYFCDELNRLYGSDDDVTAIAASYAIENWAQAGFWDELTQGFDIINQKRASNNQKPLSLSFWKYHSMIESQHAAHTVEELKEVYLSGRIEDEYTFLYLCEEMLDAINIFWKGLENNQKIYENY